MIESTESEEVGGNLNVAQVKGEGDELHGQIHCMGGNEG
jgi:hypothetical protein